MTMQIYELLQVMHKGWSTFNIMFLNRAMHSEERVSVFTRLIDTKPAGILLQAESIRWL